MNEFDAKKFIQQHGSKSQAIRALDKKGLSRGEIALLLQVKYQHVRNVLITPVKNPGKSSTKAKKTITSEMIAKAMK